MLAVSANAAVEYTGSAVAKGTFYLYNVGTGKFLNGGDNTAGWSTHGWLTTFGRYAELTANGTGYNINLGYDNSKNRKYLNTDGWCDGDATAWTFTLVDGQENVYYINNGDKYLVGGSSIAGTRGVQLVTGSKDTKDDSKNQWKLVTRDNIIAALSQASQENGVDATSLIDCFGFDRNDTRSGSWTKTDAVNVFCGTNGASITKDTKNLGCEAYGKVFSLSQTVKGLPSGKYVLSVQGFGATSPTYLYCGEEKKQIISTNDTGNMDKQLQFMIAPDKYKNNLPFTYVASDKGMTFGLNRPESADNAWACWDNFSLTYYGVDLTELQNTHKTVVDESEALYESLPTAAKEALKAVVDANNKSYTSEGEFNTAITNIRVAKATATAILSAYDAYNAKKTVVVALKTQEVYTDNSGAATALDAAIAAQDNVVNSATTAEAINTATAALVASANTFVSSVILNDNAGFDMTAVAVTNADVWRTIDGWVNETNAERGADAKAKTMEFYKKNDFNLYQSVPVVKGYYRLTVKGFHRINCSPIYAYAGDLAKTTFKQELVGIANATAGSQTAAGAWLDNELNGNNVLEFSTEAGNINIGVKNEFTSTDHGDGKDGWTVLRSFKLEYLGESPLSVLKAANDKAKAAAQALLNNGEYTNVTGDERTTLAHIINVGCTTSDDYVANTTAINNAMIAFTSAVASYNAYVAMKTYPEKFNVSVNVATPNTAADADDAVLLFKERTYDAVLTKYALDITDKTIGDFDTWTFTTTKQTANGEGLTRKNMSGEHYIDGTHTYYEGNQYAKVGWGYTMTKSVVLNPGEYVIKAAARAATTVNVTMTVNDGTSDIATKTLVHKGNTGYGIDTSGDCNFHSTGNYVNNNSGRGWEWEMIRFDLNEKKTVTITYSAETDAQFAWANICDASLLASQIDVPITINEGKTATTIGSEYALDFTDAEGIEAYTVSEINGSYAKMEQVTGAVPANTGLVITGTPGTYYAKVTQEAATLAGTNYLEAVTTETKYTSDESNTYYVYGALNGVEGFYKAAGYTVPAGKAVLKVPVSQYAAKAAIYLNGGATGVAEVEAGADTDSEPIYNVCGQRISKAKGLVIKGGKKYFVK